MHATIGGGGLPGDAEPHVVHRHTLHSIIVRLEAAYGVTGKADHMHKPPEGTQDNGVLLYGDGADFIIANNV